jgi:hypothetical protein
MKAVILRTPLVIVIACGTSLLLGQNAAQGKEPEVQIKISEPSATPDAEERAQVKVVWPLQVLCPCEALKVKQEIKGYIELTNQTGAKSKKTARDIVSGRIGGVAAGASKEVDDFRSGPGDPTKPDTSETEFIPDIGGHGTSTYPKDLMKCKDNAGKPSDVELTDEPGTTARAGPGKPWKNIQMRLVFRTTVLSKDKILFSFIWHVNYDLPPGAGKPDVNLGEP